MFHLTRRSLLGASTALGAAALTGCASTTGLDQVNAAEVIPRADGPVVLTYWSWLKDLQSVCDIFNASQDRIRVEATWITPGDDGGYAKLLSANAAGGGPDLAQIELRAIMEFALAGAVLDLGRYGANRHEDQFDPAAWTQVTVDDAVYGIPQDTGPVAMFYQPHLLDAVGADVPTTWPEFEDVARQVRAHDPAHYLASFDPSDASRLVAYAMQAGAVWFQADHEGWVVDMTDDATLQVAAFWDRMIEEDLVTTSIPPLSTPWYAAAGEGRIYSTVSGSWADALIQTVPDGAGKWRVAPMPRWDFGYASGGHGGSSAAVMANSEHPAEALEFAVWMCSSPEGVDALIEHSGIGWSAAADYIGASREQPSEFFGGQEYNEEVIVPMAEGQNLDWMWPPIVQRTMNILSDGMRARVGGGPSLVEFLPAAQAEIAGIMRDMGLTVEEKK